MKILLCVLSLFVMLSCSKMTDSNEAALIADEAMVAVMPSTAPPDKSPKTVPERKLIRNGSLSFEVEDVIAVRKSISELTTELGGYSSSEKQHKHEGNAGYKQVVRIPGEKLDEFVAKVEGFAKQIDDKDFSAQDVTEEYVDLQSRLTAKKELDVRFREIVKQAKTIEDILEVEEEIGIVRGEIEQIEGRLKYLSNKTSYSTVTLTYYENNPIALPGTVSKFADSFVGGWDALVVLLIAITRTWPFLLILGTLAWFIMRRKRKEPNQVIQPQ